METARVTIQLTPADIQRYEKFCCGGTAKRRFQWVLVVIAFVLIAASFFLSSGNSEPARLSKNPPHRLARSEMWKTAVLPVLFLGFYIYFHRQAKRAKDKNAIPSLFLPHTYSVTEEGLHCNHDHSEILNRWPAVKRFVEAEEDFYIMLGQSYGHPLPRRCFSTQEEAAIFANQVRLHLEKHAPAALAAA